MAATQQGGHALVDGRPRFVAAASKRPARAVLRFDKLEHLEAAGRISLGLIVCGASSITATASSIAALASAIAIASSTARACIACI